MAAHPEPHAITGYTSQLAGTVGYGFANTTLAQAHGNPGPHDKRPGYGQPGEPGGIDPVIQTTAGANAESKVRVAPGVDYDDTAQHKRGWSVQNR